MNTTIVLNIFFLCTSTFSPAQIGIGTNALAPKSLLEFEDNCSTNSCSPSNAKGIILPILTNTSVNNFVNGTFVLDESDKILKVFENNVWRRLSYLPGNLDNVVTPKTSIEVGDGVYLGDNKNGNDLSAGVLELNSLNKVLILPRIYKPYETVENPYPGMMCYDTDSKSLMIFDGRYWNIWKEERSPKIIIP